MCLVGRLFAILIMLTLGACGSTSESLQLQPGVPPAPDIENQHSNVDQGDGVHDSQECDRHQCDSTSQDSKIDWRKAAENAAGVTLITFVVALNTVFLLGDPTSDENWEGFTESWNLVFDK